MGKHKRGFTIIEVLLFLAVTTALFVGIASGVQGSIYQQRYTDAVQNFAEFLRSAYSQASNVQSESMGRGDKAIYGKVLTFRANDDGRGNIIKTYNLIGDVERVQTGGDVGVDDPSGAKCVQDGGGAMIKRLGCLNADVIVDENAGVPGGVHHYKPVGFVETYVPRWSSEIQTTVGWGTDSKYDIFEGIIVIARSPSSGNVATYIWRGSTDVVDTIKEIEKCERNDYGCTGAPLAGKLAAGGFTNNEDIDFCVNPNGYEFANIRRNIRLSRGAHNASAVDVITDDKENAGDNRCE